MSKKKKAQQEALAAQAAQLQNSAAPRPITASFRIMNNCRPVPVAPPADMIQLTPAVQPIPVSMYSIQQDAGMYQAGGYADQFYDYGGEEE